MMHNLGIGGLEFNNSHTLAQHRPDDFTLPDIPVIEHGDLRTEHDFIEKKEANPEVKYNHPESEADWNDESWPEILFRDMHDPEHRHASKHHGNYE